MKQIDEVEKELEETRNKCAQLSSHLESRKVKMIEQAGRAWRAILNIQH